MNLVGIPSTFHAGIVEQRRAYLAEIAARRATREQMLLMMETDTRLRDAILAKVKKGDAEGVIEFFETFLYTFDPREDMDGNPIGKVPFLLDEEQKDFIRWHCMVEKGIGKRSGHAVKSRDRGATWMMVGIRLLRWLFSTGYISLVGHQTEDDIDKSGEQKCIFWKFDYYLDNLPKYLVPEGWRQTGNNRHLIRIHPENGNIFKGDPVTNTWGGGDRVTDAWMDEAGECLFGREGFDKVGFTANCRFTTGTPPRTGIANWWSRIVKPLLDAKYAGRGIDSPNLSHFELCWENDPRYNYHYIETSGKEQGRRVYPWYEQQKTQFAPEVIARELDRNFEGSMIGQVYPGIQRATKAIFHYDPTLSLYLAVDPGVDDKFGLVWIQPDRENWRILQAYENRGKSAGFYLAIILGRDYSHFLDNENALPEDYEIAERVSSWVYHGFCGDPAGRNRSATDLRSVYTLWREESYRVTPHRYVDHVEFDVAEGKDMQMRIQSLRAILPRFLINMNWAGKIPDYVASCRFPPENENAENPKTNPLHNTPGRDTVTALEYFAISRFCRYRSFSKTLLRNPHADMRGVVFGSPLDPPGMHAVPDYLEEEEERQNDRRDRLPVARRMWR